ncbi:MAG: hypothetical protein KAI86_01155, partial [Desulfobacterales bacterium]|nr:hypothetical protein [Desulfobacterales bacterium]
MVDTLFDVHTFRKRSDFLIQRKIRMSTPPIDIMVKEAIALAETWQNRANELMNHRERSRYTRFARLLANPRDKIFLTKLIDQSFRSSNPRRVADQIGYLFSEHGLPAFFSPLEKLLMQIFNGIGRYFP